MNRAIQRSTRLVVPASLAVAPLGGCTAVQDPTYPPTTGAVLGAPNSTVDYPGGRYQLYGSGTSASPYYWVWVPAVLLRPASAAGPYRERDDGWPVSAVRRGHHGVAVLLGLGARGHDCGPATPAAPAAVARPLAPGQGGRAPLDGEVACAS